MKPDAKKLNAWAKKHSVQVNFHVKMVALLLLIIILPLEQLFSSQMANREMHFLENLQSSVSNSYAIDFFKFVGYLGNMWVIQGTATILFYLFDPLHSMKLTIVAAYGVYFASLLNMILREPRPYFLSRAIKGHDCADGFGMPSHSLTVATICYSFMLIMYIHRRSLVLRISAYLGMFLLMLLIAVSRVLLGSNFPHQVVTTLLYDYLYVTMTFTFDSTINKLSYRSSHNYEKNKHYSVYWFIATLGCLLASLFLYMLFPLHFRMDIEWENNAVHDCGSFSGIISAAPLYDSSIIFYVFGVTAGSLQTSKWMPKVWWRGVLWKRVLCSAGAIGVEVAIYFTLSETYADAIPVYQVMSRYCLHNLLFYFLCGYSFTGILPYIYYKLSLLTIEDKTIEDEEGIFLESGSA